MANFSLCIGIYWREVEVGGNRLSISRSDLSTVSDNFSVASDPLG